MRLPYTAAAAVAGVAVAVDESSGRGGKVVDASLSLCVCMENKRREEKRREEKRREEKRRRGFLYEREKI